MIKGSFVVMKIFGSLAMVWPFGPRNARMGTPGHIH